MTIAIHINAGNDRNGNPKRGWLIFDSEGTCRDFVNEGFAGTGALQAMYSSAVQSNITIDVAPSVYREALKQAYGGLPSAASQASPKRSRR